MHDDSIFKCSRQKSLGQNPGIGFYTEKHIFGEVVIRVMTGTDFMDWSTTDKEPIWTHYFINYMKKWYITLYMSFSKFMLCFTRT